MATYSGKNQDFNDNKGSARQYSDNLKETAKSTAANVIGMNTQDLTDMAQEAGKTVRRYIDDTSEQVIAARDTLEQRVVMHPLSSVAIAAVAGFFLGALLRR